LTENDMLKYDTCTDCPNCGTMLKQFAHNVLTIMNEKLHQPCKLTVYWTSGVMGKLWFWKMKHNKAAILGIQLAVNQ